MWKRLKMILSAKFSKALDRAEDPGEALDYSYQKQRELLQNVKKGIVDVVTAKKRLELQREKLVQNAAKLEMQAKQALQQNREDLARTALERKAVAQTEIDSLTQQIDAMAKDQANLETKERQLAANVERFKTRKEVIKANYSAAEAQVKISEAVTGVGDEFAAIGQAVQRAEERTEDMKARAGAMDELMDSGVFEDALGTSSDPIERQLAAVAADQAVEDDLASLKAELGMGSPAPSSLPAGEQATAQSSQGGVSYSKDKRA